MSKFFNVVINNSEEINKDFLEKVAGREFHRVDYDGFNVGDKIRGYARNGRLTAIFFIVEK